MKIKSNKLMQFSVWIQLLRKYLPEFLLIFISVLLAFFLTEWSARQGDHDSEQKILLEIRRGIFTDSLDFSSNINGHKYSIRGIKMIRNWANNLPYPIDSFTSLYSIAFRNYSPIINKTGYESLKQTNLKTLSNDSLRFQIIKLYEYHYNIIEQIENVNAELQDFKNHFETINTLLSPYMIFDEKGNLLYLKQSTLSKAQKNLLLSLLWRIEINKSFKLIRYKSAIDEMNKLSNTLDREMKS
jgi:hypothetical protein